MHTCHHCLLRTDLCICQCAPQRMQSSLQLLVLTHPAELHKISNTGKLLTSLPGYRRLLWQRKESAGELQELMAASGQRGCLLYPPDSEDPGRGPEWEPEGADNGCFLLLDGTWQQTAKMLRQCDWLRQLPRLALTPPPSQFSLRRNQQPGSVSTVETAIALLRRRGDVGDAEALQSYFQRFQRACEAHRSGHSKL